MTVEIRAHYTSALPYYPSQKRRAFAHESVDNRYKNIWLRINAMAQNDLSERMTSIVIRQALRVVAKDRGL